MCHGRAMVLGLLLTLHCLQGVAPGQSLPRPIQVLIHSKQLQYKFGEPITIEVSVRNLTAKTIMLARPLDQFESRFRYPHSFFELRNDKGEIMKPAWVGDKPPDPITPEAFFSLAAGQKVALYPGGCRLDLVIPDTGAYDVAMRYSTLAEKEWEWYGPYSDQYWENRIENSFWRAREPEILRVRELLKKILPVAASSNPLRIRILPRNVTREESLKIAEEVCRLEKWLWAGISAIDRGDFWDINTNWGRLGQNGFVRIDKKTGKILQKHMTGN